MKRGFTVPTPGMRVDARRLSYCEMVWEPGREKTWLALACRNPIPGKDMRLRGHPGREMGSQLRHGDPYLPLNCGKSMKLSDLGAVIDDRWRY